MDNSFFRGAIPEAVTAFRKIRKVTTTEKLECVSISESVWGFQTHWVDGRTDWHKEYPEHCEHCVTGNAIRYLGLLYVQPKYEHRALYLQLSRIAARNLHAVFQDRANLRGCMFEISRTKGGARGRYIINPLEKKMDSKSLPNDENPEDLLRRLIAAKRK